MRAQQPGISPPRRRRWVAGGLAVAAVVVIGAVAVQKLREEPKEPPPAFVSLQDEPDPTLRGTVAYYSPDGGCVRVVSASGSASKDVLCFDARDREHGPQLAWRPDGRLEITVFRWPGGGEIVGAWQKIVDVTTGDVEDVPPEEVPWDRATTPVPAVGPNGEEVMTTSGRGRLTVTLTKDGERRTLLEEYGDPDYGVHLGDYPVWSPNGDWILYKDGRLLLTTVGDEPVTRILADDPGGIGRWDSAEIRTFAATDTELLPVG